MKQIFVTLFTAAILQNSMATTIHVPGDYTTIQAALNAANPFDVVSVDAGTYAEHIVWPFVDDITLSSSTGNPANTIIDGTLTGRVITIDGIGPTDIRAVISGFTIKRGKINVTSFVGVASGISLNSAKLTLTNCLITQNTVTTTDIDSPNGALGAGVYALSSTLIVSDCQFTKNSISNLAFGSGVGLYVATTPSSVTNCSFSANTISVFDVGQAVIFNNQNNMTLTNVSVTSNTIQTTTSYESSSINGSGLYNFYGTLTLTNCLIAKNKLSPFAVTSVVNGGGIFYIGVGGGLKLTNCTLATNKRSDGGTINGSSIYYSAGTGLTVHSLLNSILYNPNAGDEIKNVSGGTLTAEYCDIRGGYTGTGNINVNPKFVTAADFHLKLNSACINTGTNSGAPVYDITNGSRPLPAGTNADMGCYEMDQPLRLAPNIISIDDVNVYPNPFSTELQFDIAGDDAETIISIFDITGGLIQTQHTDGNGHLTLNTADLPAGIYLYEIKNKTGITSGRIVKN